MYNWRIHEYVVPKKIHLLHYAISFHPSFLLFLLLYRSQKARNGIKKVLMRLFKTTRSHIKTTYYLFRFVTFLSWYRTRGKNKFKKGVGIATKSKETSSLLASHLTNSYHSPANVTYRYYMYLVKYNCSWVATFIHK